MKKLGFKCKFYVDDTGAVGDGSWSEVKLVSDTLTIGREKDEVEVADRSDDWIRALSGMKKSSIETTLIYDRGDTNIDLLLSRWTNDAVLGCAAADGNIATAGTRSWQFDAEVLDIGEEQPLKDKLTRKLKLVPSAQSTLVPQEVTT